MRKLIVQEFVSIDGFAADRDGTTSFFDGTKYAFGNNIDEDMAAFIQTVDFILLGRNTYSLFRDYWPDADPTIEQVAEPLNSTPKYIFSNTLKQVDWGKWHNAYLASEDTVDFIKSLKATGNGNLVVWGSLNLLDTLFRHQLVDEIHLITCPVAIGKGRTVVPEGVEFQLMDLLSYQSYPSGITKAEYNIRK